MATPENIRQARNLVGYLIATDHAKRPQVFRMKGGQIRRNRGTWIATLFGITGSSVIGEISAVSDWKSAVGRAVQAEAAR